MDSLLLKIEGHRTTWMWGRGMWGGDKTEWGGSHQNAFFVHVWNCPRMNLFIKIEYLTYFHLSLITDKTRFKIQETYRFNLPTVSALGS